MSKIKALADRLRACTPEVVKQQALKSLRSHETTAINMNTDQLFAGRLANGEKMPDYSETSVMRFGKRPGPYRMYETGDFFDGFFMQAHKFPVIFNSRDLKTPRIMDLIESKGLNPNELFGLDKTNFTDMALHYVLPDLQGWLRSVIRLR